MREFCLPEGLAAIAYKIKNRTTGFLLLSSAMNGSRRRQSLPPVLLAISIRHVFEQIAGLAVEGTTKTF